MTPQDVITTLLGAVLPLVIALVNQTHWRPQVKGLVTLLLCLIAATVVAWLRNQLDWTDWRRTVLLVTGAALVAYQVFWKPSQIAPHIEAATTPGSRQAPPRG